MSLIAICNRIIEYSFYALFFLVPLVFVSDTSELFEFNKLWITFGFTIVIGAAWFIKMILQKRFFLQRTPLDIPIGLFLLSQILSTIFSIDPHVSLWGYYSRFNGGLLSIISYVFLYYAFVSNLAYRQEENGNDARIGNVKRQTSNETGFATDKRFTIRLLYVSLISGAIVTLWGIPSHFGYDPTCFLIRGELNVDCWTEAFQPRVRIFSTLGQPNWMAAYLAILLPIALALGLQNSKHEYRNSKQYQNTNDKNTKRFDISDLGHFNFFRISDFGFRIYFYLLFTILFYLAILFTDSRSGFVGLAAGLLLLAVILLIRFFKVVRRNIIFLSLIVILMASSSLIINRPFGVATKLKNITSIQQPKVEQVQQKESEPQEQSAPQGPALEVGGTESGNIRRIVWQGAIDMWKANPIFGTGVETFAYSYYQYRPAEHNLTSEWDFLYNKAHNEHLNYLATTGAFGLGTYLLMAGVFIFIALKYLLNSNIESRNSKQYQNTNDKNFKHFEHSNLFRASDFGFRILVVSLLAAYVSIHVSNFLGFSVVIANLYLFLIPALVFILAGIIDPQRVFAIENTKHDTRNTQISIGGYQWAAIATVLLVTCYMLLVLFRYWLADRDYSLGYNLGRVGQHEEAYQYLKFALDKRPNEPTFLDEFSIVAATLAASYVQKNNLETAKILVAEAIDASDKVTQNHPNNVVFWKTRTRVFATLSQLNPQYATNTLFSIEKAGKLAPTDAKVLYNLGIVYGQTGNIEKAIEVLEETVKLKQNYIDAYYALGLFYNEKGNREKAIETMNYILENINPNHTPTQTALKTWGAL